jgi:hypothetical protein
MREIYDRDFDYRSESINWTCYEQCMKAIAQCVVINTPEIGKVMAKVRNRTAKIHILQFDGYLLEFIRRPTYYMYEAAVRSEPFAIKYVPLMYHTLPLCQLALRMNVNSFRYFPPDMQSKLTELDNQSVSAK